jgi:hypothetical protein
MTQIKINIQRTQTLITRDKLYQLAESSKYLLNNELDKNLNKKFIYKTTDGAVITTWIEKQDKSYLWVAKASQGDEKINVHEKI